MTRELVTDDVLIEVSADRTIIFEDREAISQGGELIIQGPQAASSYTCPIPSTFSIVGDSSGVPISNWKLEDTSKPAGTTTQWVVFDFWTENYRDRGSHMPVVLFWDEVLHGWGAILGDNHISSDGCGSSARFNSQVEGFLSVGTPPANPPTTYWQNAVYSSTCGNEMYDGYVVIVPLWYSVPRYRLEMQASTGHWVSYRIFEYSASLGDWEVLTDWQTVDTDTGNWYDPPPLWTPNTEGIFFGATPASSSGTWSINISNTQCGWF